MTSTSTDRIDGLVTSQAIKAPVRVATTANITLASTQTIDGVAVVAFDRVLVKDQTTGTEDGIYVVGASNWDRAKDWNGARDATQGTIITVRQGTINANSVWRSTASDNTYVIGTVSPTFQLAEFFGTVSGDMKYNFDSSTVTTEDPGTGDFRLNNATVASATVMTMAFNSADGGGPDVSTWIASWDDSTTTALRGTVRVAQLGTPSIFAVFNVTGAITQGADYLDVPLTYVTGSGAFTASEAYVISFSRTGDQGTGDLQAANNLSDVDSAVTSLSNIGGIGAATTDTLTNKTFDANGTGNSLSNVDVADLANGTDGELITWDAAGAPAVVAVGTAAQVLTSNGVGAAPTFQTLTSGPTATAFTALTSGTTSDITSIPSTATRISVCLDGVFTSGSSGVVMLLGDSGGFETTGYISECGFVTSAAQGGAVSTARQNLWIGNDTSNNHFMIIEMRLIKSSTNQWLISANGTMQNNNRSIFAAGNKSLSAVLTQLRIQTLNLTDTFSAGNWMIMYD